LVRLYVLKIPSRDLPKAKWLVTVEKSLINVFLFKLHSQGCTNPGLLNFVRCT